MKIHEYQGKEILARFGIPVPRGYPAFSVREARPTPNGELLRVGFGDGSLWVLLSPLLAVKDEPRTKPAFGMGTRGRRPTGSSAATLAYCARSSCATARAWSRLSAGTG